MAKKKKNIQSPPKTVLWQGNQKVLDEMREMMMTYVSWALELGRDRDLINISGGNLHAINSAITTASREIERFEKLIAVIEEHRGSNKTVLEWAEPPNSSDEHAQA